MLRAAVSEFVGLLGEWVFAFVDFFLGWSGWAQAAEAATSSTAAGGVEAAAAGNLDDMVLWRPAWWRIGIAALIVFISFLSRKLIVGIFKRSLENMAKGTAAQWDDDLVRMMPTPLSVAVQLLLFYAAVYFLDLPKQPVNIRDIAFQGLQVAVIVTIGWTLFRLVDVFMLAMERLSEKTESKLDDQIVPLVRKTFKVVIGVTVFVMTVDTLGYSITGMIASLGVGGLAIALAAQDTVANLFGSVVIFTDRPFQVGDWVEFDGIQGDVEEVGFRTTRIRRFDKSLVTVPNSTFSKTAITNHSARPKRRLDITVGVTYESKPKQLRELLEALRNEVKTHEGLDRGFQFVHFTEMGATSLNIRVYCFTVSTHWVTHLTVQESLMLRIMEIVQENGLEMAFPTQTVYLRDEKWKENAN